MKKILLWCTLLTAVWLNAQTQHIPVTQGGFEAGDTFAANGWSSDSGSATNKWVVGPLTNGPGTGNSAFISNSTAAPYDATYTTSSASVVYFWRDITIPAGESKIKLDFDWIANGESTWDLIQILVAPTTVTPVPSTSSTGSITGSSAGNAVPLGVDGATSIGYVNLQTSTTHATFYLPPSLAGTTFRLIFSWRNDTSGGANPSGQIDNITLSSQVAGTFSTIASGDWSNPLTWDANAVPSPADQVTVNTGHAVVIDNAGYGANNLTVNGSLEYGTTPTSFSVGGNLTIGNTGFVNVFNGTTGKTLIVSGNIVNNGIMDISVGATTAGNLTLSGSAMQTISGNGTFANGKIRNLTFANSSTATPNITWNMGDIRVVYNLNMAGARIAMGTSKLAYGDNAVGNTLTAPAGSGLVSGKFARYYTASTTGSTITAGSLPTATTTKYPFISADGKDRSMWITRTNATTAAAGELGVVYNDVAGISNVSITDGTYTADKRTNANWVVSDETGTIAASSYRIAVAGDDLFPAINGEHRIVNASSALAGDHQNGTAAPSGQRVLLPQADLLSGPLYLAYNEALAPHTAVANGNWNAASTWNKGTVPTCTSAVLIPSGYTVTVNSATNSAARVDVYTGGSLVVVSGDITVGCTDNNSTLTNNGTVTVSGGTLAVNGNIWNAASSTLNQSGGDIIIDGNNGGSVTGSVASGTALLHMASNDVNMTGGVLTIVDPHAATTASNSINYTFGTSGSIVFSPNHTLRFGDGVSTDAGGNLANGFRINTFASSGRISKFGKMEINTLGGTNRHVTTTYTFGVHDLEIHANSQFRMNSTSLYVAGNFVNNGLYVSSTTTYLADYSNALNEPTNVAQTISGTGQFHNASITVSTLPTLNDVIYSLNVNNSSTAGVTLARPFGLSNVLTLTEGVVHTSTANLLSVGFNTTAGTMTTGSNTAYIDGPVSKIFANNYTGTQLFPVGKGGSYSPIWISPKTTAVSKFTAQAFNTNTGTASSSIAGLANDRRWEVALDSGTYSTIKVKVGGPNIQGSNIIVQAPTANGVYTNDFGNVATFLAATATSPATIESDVEKNAADFTGFISYANPLCPAPSLVTATTTFTSANISWTGTTMAANGYVVYYSTVNTAPDGSTVLDATNSVSTASPSATSVTIPGLTPETGYYVWVRSACSSTENSEWVGPIFAYTGYCPVTSTSQATWFSGINSSGAVTNLNYSSPTATTGTNGYQNLSATQKLANYAGSTANVTFALGGATAGISVWVDWNNDLVFDTTERVHTSSAYVGTTPHTGAVAVPAGTAVGEYRMRMVVNYNSTAPNDACVNLTRGEYIDMTFEVTATPTCFAPTGITVGTVTSATADLTWTAATPVPGVGYEVYYSTSNVAPTASTVLDATNSVSSTSNNAQLTGLAGSSTYYVWVRSACSASDKSSWSAMVSVITACSSVTAINENFDSYPSAAGSLPTCWNLLPGSSTSWARINNGQSSSPSNGLYLYGGPGDDQGVSLNAVTGLDSGTLSLQFKLRMGTTAGATLKVGYLDPANGNAFEPITTFTTTNAWVTHTMSLTGIPTGVTQLAFLQNSGTSTPIYIDDVKVDLTSSLAVTDVKNIASDDVKVYPNPFTDLINISDVKDLKSVSVIDASGRMVKTIATPGTQIHLGELKSGLYILKLDYRNGSVKTVKVVKK